VKRKRPKLASRTFRKRKRAEQHAERLRGDGSANVRVERKRPPDGDITKTRWVVTWTPKPRIGNIKATMGVGSLGNKTRFWRGR
jgi:hypothetical protein